MKIHCAICRENVDENAQILATKCGHIFHSDCLNRWLITNSTCPQCRTQVQRDQDVIKLYLLHTSDRTYAQEKEVLKLKIKILDLELGLLLEIARNQLREEQYWKLIQNMSRLQVNHDLIQSALGTQILENEVLQSEFEHFSSMCEEIEAAAIDYRAKVASDTLSSKEIGGVEVKTKNFTAESRYQRREIFLKSQKKTTSSPKAGPSRCGQPKLTVRELKEDSGEAAAKRSAVFGRVKNENHDWETSSNGSFFD